mgnify:CR=1 FL=1
MRRISLAITFLFVILFTFSNVHSEKEPVWQYYSTDSISSVEISDDSVNISATYAKTVSLWRNDTSTPYNSKTVGLGITSMDMSANGKYVVTGEEADTTITLWDEGSMKWDKTDFFLSLIDLDINPNGTHIAVVDFKNVYYFSTNSDTEIWVDNYASDSMSSVAISPNNQYIAAGTEDGNVYVYDTSSSAAAWYHSNTLDGKITDLDFSSDSNYLIIGSENGKIYIYDSEGDTPLLEYGQLDYVTCVSGSSNPNHYAFGTDAGLITLLDLSTDFKLWDKNIGGSINGLDFNGDAKYLVAGSSNRKLVLVNVSDGDELWRTSVFGEINDLSMSYRGQNIIVGTDSGLALYYENQLDNQAPTVTIENVNPTTTLPGNLVSMVGSASDSDGIVIEYLWHSSIDGNISTESNFTISNLSQGYHVISFSAMDNEGKWSKPVTIDVGIGDFPEATIDSISGCNSIDNCVLNEGTIIEFQGSAVSEASEDAEVIGYQWESNLDGFLSDQSSFSTSSLTLGSHIIIFRAVNDIGFWSSNVTANVLVNGVPVLNSVNFDSNVVAGQSLVMYAEASDPDGNELTYTWTSETLFFANGANLYESSENGSSVVTSDSDIGEKLVYLMVTDSLGASSGSFTITINVLSPPLVSAICDEEAVLDQELLFTAIASDKGGGRIISYEWDFDSSTGDIDTLDFQGADFATYSYNYTPPESSFLVVVRVTDDDGLTARDTCTVSIVADTTSKSSESSSSSGNDLGSITEIANPPVIIGILLIIGAIGAVIYYLNREEESSSYEPPSKPAPISGSEFMDSVVPEKSPVKERRVRKRKVVRETMTIECPECAARMDIPKVSGTQEIKCLECGLEGEIEL